MFGWCVTTNTCIIRFSRFHWRRRSVASTVELFGRQVRARPKVCHDRSPMMMMLGCVLVERTLFWVPTVRLAREEMAGPAQWKCFAKWISIVVICFARFFFSENVLCVDAACLFPSAQGFGRSTSKLFHVRGCFMSGDGLPNGRVSKHVEILESEEVLFSAISSS